MHVQEKFIRSSFALSDEPKIEALLGYNPFKKFHVGRQAARGYADVGYEEFFILPGQKLLSLTTGKVSQLVETEVHHYIVLLSPDDLADVLERMGVEKLTAQYRRGRWHCGGESKNDDEGEVSEESLSLALLSMVAKSVGMPLVVDSARQLKVSKDT